jgi:predicted transcriptional regulator of viral defense system
MFRQVNHLQATTINKIKNIALYNNGFIETRELTFNRISKTYITTMVKMGYLERIKKGLYRLTDLEPVAYEYFIDAQKAIPQGVICFFSALKYHNLTTINPDDIYLAIPRKSHAVLPEYPPVKIYYLTEKYYKIGIDVVTIRKEAVKIYSKEKTLCDCIKYRSKIGSDQTIEAFKTYLSDKANRNLPLLLDIAEECGVSETVRHYAEALI